MSLCLLLKDPNLAWVLVSTQTQFSRRSPKKRLAGDALPPPASASLAITERKVFHATGFSEQTNLAEPLTFDPRNRSKALGRPSHEDSHYL